MFFKLGNKKMGFLSVSDSMPEFFNGKVFSEAYNINHSGHCHVRDISWDVAVLENGQTHYYATIYYIKDNENAKPIYGHYDLSKKNMIWFDLVWGYSQEEFKERLEEKLDSLESVKDISQKVIVVNGKLQYLAMVSYVKNEN